jgi:hypothetical protein
MRWKIGDRVLVCGHHPGTVTDVFTYMGRTTYSVRFDRAPYSRIPQQTAISLREEDLERLKEKRGGCSKKESGS